MPHDVMPVSSALYGFDDPSSPSQMRKPGILSAMREAGQALVQKAKRTGTKTILSAMIAAGAALGAAHTAEAQVVTATMTGTMTSGTDGEGIFTTTGGSLTGLSFTLTYSFDTKKGDNFPTHAPSYIINDATNPGTAVLTINGKSYPFGSLSGNSSEAAREAGSPPGAYLKFLVQDSNGYTFDNVDMVLQPTTSPPVVDGNWQDQFSYSGAYTSGSYHSFSINNFSTPGTTSGYFTVSTLNVSGLLPTAPVGKVLGGNNNNGVNCDCPKQAGKTDSSTNEPSGTGDASTGDPINIATGNVYYSVTDYSSAGPNPLQLIRSYNGMGNANGIDSLATSLGTNWRTNYDRYLQLGATTVAAERPDGQVLGFTQSGSSWKSDSDVDVTLVQSGSTWTLTDANDNVETYTATTGSFGGLSINYGQLQSIQARNGYTQNLSRSGSTMTVTDSYGRQLEFTYSSSTGLLQQVTTPDTLVLSYTQTLVSGAGYQLTTVGYNTSPATSQTYTYGNASFPFALTGVTDENGNAAAAFTYDNIGRGLTSQNALGVNATALAYNADGTVTVTNPFGVADTYHFVTQQGMAKLTEIDRVATSNTAAATRTFGYDTNGYMNAQTDWNGNQTTYVNDTHGQPTTINEAVGTTAARTTTIAYDPTFVHEPATITTPGLTTSFTYYPTSDLHTRTDTDTTTNSVPYSTNGQTRTTTYVWSGTGQETSVTLPRTDSTVAYTFTYVPSGSTGAGALASITDPMGHTTNITAHTGGGLPTSVTDPNAVVTTLVYDTRLNLNTSTLHLGGTNLTTTWTHDAANNLASYQQPDGSLLTYSRNAANQLTGVLDSIGNTLTYTPDALGNNTSVTAKNGTGTVTYTRTDTFDNLGRLITDLNGAGHHSYFTWDLNSNLLTLQPPSPSGLTSFGYDALNRRITKTDPAIGGVSGVTTTGYDAHNQVTSVEDPNSLTTSYVHDGFSDTTQVASPDAGTSVFVYDGDRNMTQSTLPGGRITNMTYDLDDRQKTRSFPADSTLNATFNYDEGGHGWGIGRLTSGSDQAGPFSFSYEQRGLVIYEARTLSDIGQTLGTSYTYDNDSRISQIHYPSGTYVDYGRGYMGRISNVTVKPPGASSFSNLVTSVKQLPPDAPDGQVGPATAMTWGNGITGSYGYDQAEQATSRADTYGSANILNQTTSLYPNGSPLSITDAVIPANTQSFGYDAMDRLTGASGTGTGGYGTLYWTWDKTSNLTSTSFNSVITNYALVSGTNKLDHWTSGGTTTSVVYNFTNNIQTLTQGSSTLLSTLTSAANRTTNATGSTYAAYKYGFDGVRLEKEPTGSNQIGYAYAAAAREVLLSENDFHSGTTADYIYMDPGTDNRPIGEVNPATGATYALHTDRLGTVDAATDSTRTTVWNAIYMPFGQTSVNVTGSSGTLTTQSLRLPGQSFDAETGLTHSTFRDYAASITRYIQPDPSGLNGGINVYQYANANPLKYVDPKGLAGVTISNALPPDSVQYQAPDGTCFAAPSYANWEAVYNSGNMLGLSESPVAILHWGTFDFQRNAANNTFYSQYTYASNYAVGVYMNGAGYTLDETKALGSLYAFFLSSNAGAADQLSAWTNGWNAAEQGDLPGRSEVGGSGCGCPKNASKLSR